MDPRYPAPNLLNVSGVLPQQPQASVSPAVPQLNIQGQWKNVQNMQSTLHPGHLQRAHAGSIPSVVPVSTTGSVPNVVPGSMTPGHRVQGGNQGMGGLPHMVQPNNQTLLSHTMQGPGNPAMRGFNQQQINPMGNPSHVMPLRQAPQGHILPGGIAQRNPAAQAQVANQQLWPRGGAVNQAQVYIPQRQPTGQNQPLPAPGRAAQNYVPMPGYSNIPMQHQHTVQHSIPIAHSSGPSMFNPVPAPNLGTPQQFATQAQAVQSNYLKYQPIRPINTSQPAEVRASSTPASVQGVVPEQGSTALGAGTVQGQSRRGVQTTVMPIVNTQPAQVVRPSSTVNSSNRVQPLPSGTSGVPVYNGFTQSQLAVLRRQILIFKKIKKGEWDLSAETLAQIKPIPLLKPQIGRPVAGVPAATYVQNTSAPASAPNVQPLTSNNTFQLSKFEYSTPVPQGKRAPIRRFTSALCTLAGQDSSGRSGAGSEVYHLRWDVSSVMAREYEQCMNRKRKRFIRDLEDRLKEKTAPGFDIAPNGDMGRGLAVLKLRQTRLINLQKALRKTVEHCQSDIMKLNERTYRKFVRDCNRHRFEMFKQSEKARVEKAAERAQSAKRMKVTILERSAMLKDYRVLRNKGVLRLHERQARRHNKLKDDDRAKRMEALKANDFEGYQALLREQSGPASSGERYAVISRFLSDTEEYLNKLAAKVAAVKLNQEASEAAAQAIAEARDQGLSEEEVQLAARDAAQEVATNSELVRRSQNFGGDAQSRYYSLAHSVEEHVMRQPSLLQPPQGASLREYQMVGLQWMVSLYNNRLNGILADEMGLGKTVQVMALIAYLMEHKGNYGPHLIIVPNAVIVNWRAELMQWLPSVRCVYYVGNKEERGRKYQQEVQAMQFNVLVTTYEFIMRDRAKLSKVQWKYVIIDEAQRMKDRQSKLAKDLDRFTAVRRLLLTGTPLQNELRELWSLLNLLLPEVFDDKKSFTEWFGDALGLGAQAEQDGDAEWLEMEKRVVVIHRLHEILEPFMLRRQVEDVESKLPPKIPVVIKVAMSEYQSKIYNWVKATGTIRLDPESPLFVNKRHSYAPLNNKVMELRKVCNHPFLSYPFQEYTGEGLVRQCGKLHTLDRLLVKLHKTKHRVLLFSTMTKLLDILEIYLRWRHLENGGYFTFRRIDGATTLEDREAAIKDFNRKDSDVFIFLLSIRAAGRGLNLQTADTVVIYDPDPNPKNEEQAIARAHRIGQMKEVRVIYLEAVADPLLRGNEHGDPSDSQGSCEPSGPSCKKKIQYLDSIESLVRNTIQKQKIEMANEVIDAGRFDMQTTNEERKQTLENLLADEDRYKLHTNEVPSLKELNRMIGRGEEEVEIFNRIDEEYEWPRDLLSVAESPSWVLFTEEQILEAIRVTSRHQKKAQAQVNLLGLTGKMQSTKEEVVSKRRRTVTRSTKESSGGGSINEADEEDDEEVNMSTVGDDEDDVEEVLLENIEMDMEDTGTTDATGDGMSFDQAGEGGSNRELSALDGSGLLSNTPPGESLGTAVESKESKDVSTCAGASPRKKRKVTGKRTGLTVRFKSGWKKP